jgi:putative peptidoglycan lipid II flippase
VIFILLRAQIIRLILGSGKFGWEDTRIAAVTLGWFSISLIAQGLIPLFAKAFYARENTKTPTLISVISIVISIAIAYPLAKSMGVAGLALSFSIGSFINALALFVLLQRISSSILNKEVIYSVIKIFFATAVMALVLRSTAHYLYGIVDMQRFWGVLTQAGVATFVAALVYISLTYIFGSQELFWALKRGVNGHGKNSEKKS